MTRLPGSHAVSEVCYNQAWSGLFHNDFGPSQGRVAVTNAATEAVQHGLDSGSTIVPYLRQSGPVCQQCSHRGRATRLALR